MKVVFDSYTKVSSPKESTPCRGNFQGIRSNTLDDSTGIRLLYLAQSVFDMRTAENLVTVTRNDVKTNSDCSVSTHMSIPKEAKKHTVARFNVLWKMLKHINTILPTHSGHSRTVLDALARFAEGAEQSSEEVKGCEEFLCTPLCHGWL